MAEDNKKDKAVQAAAAAPTSQGEVPFVDDIVIWTEGLDAPRKLTQKDLQGLPRVDSTLMPPINSLIEQGVTIAAIPTTSGVGAACYLVNLATLKKPDGKS